MLTVPPLSPTVGERSPSPPVVVGPPGRPKGLARARAVKAAEASLVRARVVIADADPLARRVVRDALQGDTAFVVAAEACDGVEAVELARHYRPDIVLMETALPRLDGIAATQKITQEEPGVSVVVFSVHTDDDREMEVLRAGAIGFVTKDAGTAAAVQAMEAVMRGEAAISARLTMRLLERIREIPEAGVGMRPVRSPLTTREWEVLDLMSAGATTTRVAQELVLAEDTVYSHVKNIMRKLDVHTRQEAVAAANGLMRRHC